MRRKWVFVVLRWAVVILIIIIGLFFMIRMPEKSFRGPLPALSEDEMLLRERLKEHVTMLGGEIGERNLWHYGELQAAADYIEEQLADLGYEVARQEFTVENSVVCNIEAELPGGSKPGEIFVVGAHYDSVLGSPGSNDNGSGVAAVLEIARLLAGEKLERTVRLVAFVNEEPPFFQTENMGSRVYAARSRERGERIVGMISVETIGYYSDSAGSQKYPFPFSFFYPDTANFIGFVGNLGSRQLVRSAIASFRRNTQFPSEGLAAPGSITGVGWSDHWSFWKEGYPAIMITDTALFRYPYYHSMSDTPDKIDYERMARVVAGIARVVAELAGAEQLE